MLLAREFIAYLSRQLVTRLTPHTIEVADIPAATEIVTGVVTDELSAEDDLNEEVREILSDYSD